VVDPSAVPENPVDTMRPRSEPREIPLLTARWRNLVVVNYRVDPGLLAPLVPAGTELDSHAGDTFVSLVGFLFEGTRLAGRLRLGPWATFEEVNLRFYVRRSTPEGARRAVSFVREVVPHRLVASGARLLYREPYVARRMAHRWELDDPRAPESGGRFVYRWESSGSWLELSARTRGELQSLRPGSLAEFILEHYWGYTRLSGGGTREYRVAHPPWKHWTLERVDVDPGVATFYGPPLGPLLARPPHSAFASAGSAVSVFRGRRLDAP
jgi:hypothetical protein